ncbi:MAG: 4-(cytidine 5'-diphospho)-2-C-methyl-D-erythritol kinase [Pyrinomonadaceae bacterium]
MSSTSFTVPSFAKINWMLRVLGRRADGYHDIHTIFQTITLHDSLTFAPVPHEKIQLECRAPDIPTNESNLVHRAARVLQQRYDVKRGASIVLEKRVPAMAGLGGGSSNAATALVGLARLWNLSPPRAELTEMGASLGADVPFFFVGGTALGTGLGIQVAPLPDAPEMSLLVVMPNKGVSTAEAYRMLDERALTKGLTGTILFNSRADDILTDSLPDASHNDFEAVIFQLEPEIGRVKNALIEAGASQALMSGSGASVFGVFESETKQEHAALKLQGESEWRVFKCGTLSRAKYFEALGSCGIVLRASS